MNADTIYRPTKGTIPYRVLMALVSPGVLATVPLLEAIGQPLDYPSLPTVMEAILAAKLVERYGRGHQGSTWRITPLGREVARTLLSGEPAPTKLQAQPAPAIPASHVADAHPVDPPGDLADELPGDFGTFECALSSAGRLLLEVDGVRLALSKGQTDQLFAYTDLQRGVVWEAAC